FRHQDLPDYFCPVFLPKKAMACRSWNRSQYLIAGYSGGLFVWRAGQPHLCGTVPPSRHQRRTSRSYNVMLNSFTGVIRRLFIFEPELNPRPLINLPAAFAILPALTQALLFVPLLWLISPQRGPTENERFEYGTFLAAVLLLTAVPASYHRVVLIIT